MERKLKLLIVLGPPELAIQQTGLDVGVVLILARTVLFNFTLDGVIDDLTDLNVGIDPEWLNSEHFERPIATEANVTEARRDVHKKSQAAERRASLDHGNQVVGLSALNRAGQVDLIGAEHQTAIRDLQPPVTIGFLEIQHHFFVHQELIVQGQIVAIRVELPFIEGTDADVCSKTFFDLCP